jgi:DNA-binding phage protein
MTMARKTGDYHAEHIEWLKDPENAAGYLNAVIEEEDKDALLLALRNIAEAEGGMAAVAEKAHLKREGNSGDSLFNSCQLFSAQYKITSNPLDSL